jgi:hypothetical protein
MEQKWCAKWEVWEQSLLNLFLENSNFCFDFKNIIFDCSHGRTILDVTSSMRFANLVSHAKLELVKSQKSRAETTVVIVLQLACGTRLQHAFGPGISLWELLMHWEDQPNR